MAQKLSRVWGMVCEKDCYYYNEKTVDAVLAEKDAEIARLRGDIKDLWDDKHSTDKLLDERNAEIAELKDKLCEITDNVYVVIEFDRETDEFSEVEGVFLSKKEAEDFAKDCSARYLRYSYGCYEGNLMR